VKRLVSEPQLLARLRRAAWEFADRELRIEQTLASWQRAFDACLAVAPAIAAAAVPLPWSRGRLDRLAGPYAESIRRALGIGMLHNESGAEWPHTYHAGDARAAAIDVAVRELG